MSTARLSTNASARVFASSARSYSTFSSRVARSPNTRTAFQNVSFLASARIATATTNSSLSFGVNTRLFSTTMTAPGKCVQLYMSLQSQFLVHYSALARIFCHACTPFARRSTFSSALLRIRLACITSDRDLSYSHSLGLAGGLTGRHDRCAMCQPTSRPCTSLQAIFQDLGYIIKPTLLTLSVLGGAYGRILFGLSEGRQE